MISRPPLYPEELLHGCYCESDAPLEIIRRPARARSARWPRFSKEPALRVRSHGRIPRCTRLRRHGPALLPVRLRGLANVGTRGGRTIVRRIARTFAAVRSPPSTGCCSPLSQMTDLVSCPCGHAFERHDSAGCCGAYPRGRCECSLSPAQALDSAVNAVRRPGPRREYRDAATHIAHDARQ
jgi:hypothetical protein